MKLLHYYKLYIYICGKAGGTAQLPSCRPFRMPCARLATHTTAATQYIERATARNAETGAEPQHRSFTQHSAPAQATHKTTTNVLVVVLFDVYKRLRTTKSYNPLIQRLPKPAF